MRVSTVEHGLAALYALGIDNCLIQVNGPEFPILDGSAIQYVEAIQKVGLQEQNATKDYYIVKHKIEVKDEDGQAGGGAFDVDVEGWGEYIDIPLPLE